MEAKYFSALATNQKIDVENGIIFGVSVITEGEAQGTNAGTWIDKTTLSQIKAIGEKSPDGLKVKLSQSKEHDGSAGQISGALKSFRFDGDRLRADLHLLKTDSQYSKVLEMAQKMPTQFGLSVVSQPDDYTLQKIDGKNYLRFSDLSSVDIVEAPAANKGLFLSTKPNQTMSAIKYKNGTDGEHHAECECKECMSKKSTKSMTALLTKLVGLPETATENEIATAFEAKFTASAKPTDVVELTKKINDVTTELTKLTTANSNALALSQKAEIDNLMAEASRDGKVVPFENDDLYTVKDGICSIKTMPAQLAKVISKLPKGQIALSRKTAVELPKKDGQPVSRFSPEAMAHYKTQRENGALALSARFSEMGL